MHCTLQPVNLQRKLMPRPLGIDSDAAAAPPAPDKIFPQAELDAAFALSHKTVV